MLQDSQLRSEAGGDDPPAALLARVRRQPHPAPLRPGLPEPGKLLPGRAGQRHLRHREAAAAPPAGPPPRGDLAPHLARCWCWPTTSRPARRPTSTARFVRGFVTEVGGPGSHTAIVAEALEIPAVVGTGPFLTDVSGGDLVIIDGDQGLVILQPDEETLARYRHEAEEIRILAARAGAAPRSAGRNAPTASASSCSATSSSPTKSTTASTAGPTAWGSTAPSSSISAAETEPNEEVHYQAYSPRGAGDGRAAGHHPHVRPGGRQGAATCRARKTSAIPSSGCAASGWRCATCRCSARSCGRCCGPASWATCRSCSRWSPRCWSCARRRWCWPT